MFGLINKNRIIRDLLEIQNMVEKRKIYTQPDGKIITETYQNGKLVMTDIKSPARYNKESPHD